MLHADVINGALTDPLSLVPSSLDLDAPALLIPRLPPQLDLEQLLVASAKAAAAVISAAAAAVAVAVALVPGVSVALQGGEVMLHISQWAVQCLKGFLNYSYLAHFGVRVRMGFVDVLLLSLGFGSSAQ